MVHACAAAEAQAAIDAGTVDTLMIRLAVGGENSANLGAETGNETAKGTLGVRAVSSTEKAVEVQMKKLPTMRQCKAFGYIPQLGVGGGGERCLIGTNGCVETDTLPPDVVALPARTGVVVQ